MQDVSLSNSILQTLESLRPLGTYQTEPKELPDVTDPIFMNMRMRNCWLSGNTSLSTISKQYEKNDSLLVNVFFLLKLYGSSSQAFDFLVLELGY